MLSVGNLGMSPVSILRRTWRSPCFLKSLASARLLEPLRDLMILSIPHHWEGNCDPWLCARLRVHYPLVLAGGYLRTGLVAVYPVPLGSCTKVSPSRRILICV